MQIEQMRLVKGSGKLRAFFNLLFPEKMIIRDMKLMQNDAGELWAATPSRVYEHDGQKKYQPIVSIFDRSLQEKISALARQEYEMLARGTTDEDPELPF